LPLGRSPRAGRCSNQLSRTHRTRIRYANRILCERVNTNMYRVSRPVMKQEFVMVPYSPHCSLPTSRFRGSAAFATQRLTHATSLRVSGGWATLARWLPQNNRPTPQRLFLIRLCRPHKIDSLVVILSHFGSEQSLDSDSDLRYGIYVPSHLGRLGDVARQRTIRHAGPGVPFDRRRTSSEGSRMAPLYPSVSLLTVVP
jgi:hypothetical protein